MDFDNLLEKAAEALVAANADRGRTYDNSPSVEETVALLREHLGPLLTPCPRCALYHERKHQTRTNGTWKPCGHPVYLGTSGCEICATNVSADVLP